MGLFSNGKDREQFGVLLDIGSGSVLSAIVHSNPKLKHPTIIWSHREHAPLKNIDSLEQSAKAVMAALMNASIKLDSEGRKKLQEYSSGAALSVLQCSISAPWSYTVTKSISYEQPKSFVVTEHTIEELIFNAQKKVEEDLKEHEATDALGLEMIARTTMDTRANGYRIRNPIGNKTENITLSQAAVVTQEYLVDAIGEMQEKLFPRTNSRKISFILMLYCVNRDLLPNVDDVCLVDVTYEATEIGIVRDGTLRYSTHTPFGSFSLAREIAAITKVPVTEALGYLHTETPMSFFDTLNDGDREAVEAVFDTYIEKVSELFHETGDSLSIPKRISLHTDLTSEPLFTTLLEKAAKRATKLQHKITPLSKEILTKKYTEEMETTGQIVGTDTALLLSAQFFHKAEPCVSFDYF